MSDGRDRVIEQVRETLRAAPGAVPDQRAVARLLSTVWESPRPSAVRRWMDAWRLSSMSGIGATAVAAAALLAGFVTRGALREQVDLDTLASRSTQTGEFQVIPAASVTGENAPVATQFVLDDAKARSVALVGDFNGWEGAKHQLTRLESGVWTISVPLTPGRHVYSFLVDGTLVVADPRAPKVVDADFGRESSVVMVFAR